MQGVLNVFDYFKIAFHLNKANKRLYFPQIMLILLKAALFVFFSMQLYRLLADFGNLGFGWGSVKTSIESLAWRIGWLVLLAWLAATFTQAGLYNMYRECIEKGRTEKGEFLAGARRNFFKFILADIITVIAWILLLVPYIVVGILSLLSGFVLVPFLASVFTIMWKTSMAVDGINVYRGLRQGISFACRHFVPLSVLVGIKAAFLSSQGGWSGGGSGGSGSGSSANWTQGTDKLAPQLSLQEAYNYAMPYIRIGFYILVPVITAAIVFASLVRMVFEIFFGLATFVMYTENSNIHGTEAAIGGGTDVV